MINYYFTFGQNHWNSEGFPMKNVWVKVSVSREVLQESEPDQDGYVKCEIDSNHFMRARLLFINSFSSIYMEKPDKWAFQYTEDGFDKSFFPGGEFMSITEKIKL